MAKDESFQVDANLAGLLIGCDQIKETVQNFQGRLCNKDGLLCEN